MFSFQDATLRKSNTYKNNFLVHIRTGYLSCVNAAKINMVNRVLHKGAAGAKKIGHLVTFISRRRRGEKSEVFHTAGV